MYKSVLVLVVSSIIALVFIEYFSQFLNILNHFYHLIVGELTKLVPGTGILQLLRETLVLIFIPIIIGLIPAFFYWLFTRREMPLVSEIIWMVWIMLITSIALHK